MISGISNYSNYNLGYDDSVSLSKYAVHTEEQAEDAGMSASEIQGLKRSGQIQCETCAQRKYQDGSDENVSFKSASHVSPNAAGAAVRAHEGEHVANAYKKAAQNDGQVVQASVAIHTATCPECGRTYVSGGTTTTQIKYNTDNPYAQNAKSSDAANGIIGNNIDYVA